MFQGHVYCCLINIYQQKKEENSDKNVTTFLQNPAKWNKEDEEEKKKESRLLGTWAQNFKTNNYINNTYFSIHCKCSSSQSFPFSVRALLIINYNLFCSFS